MPNEERPARARPDEDELPPLPAIDDDGSTFGGDAGDDDFGIEGDGDARDLLDDATGERAPIDPWIFGALSVDPNELEERSLDEHEAEDRRASEEGFDGTSELLDGAESGLTEDSDEPDGRAVSADEAGIPADSEGGADDGGAEGTGEDPALAIDREPARASKGSAAAPSDDDGLDDESPFEDASELAVRAALERESWPTRADVRWTCEPIVEPIVDVRPTLPPATTLDPHVLRALQAVMRVGDETRIVAHGALVAASTFGAPLALSTDGGVRFSRLRGCSTATAIAAVPGAPGGRALVVALYDAARDVSGLVLVRVGAGEPLGELVVDAIGARAQRDDDAEEWARIETLSVEARADGGVDVIARGIFGAVRARG